MLVYVDDVLLVGLRARELCTELQMHVLLRETAELVEGTTAKFLGRVLRHAGTTIYIQNATDYIKTILQEYGLTNANPVGTTGTKSSGPIPMDYLESLSDVLAALYRRIGGVLMWMVPLRPDIDYAVKELTRGLQSPTTEDNYTNWSICFGT